jgi:hypothetical protein
MTRRKLDEHALEDYLAPEQALLFSALREEFNAKVSSLKAWGIAALVGGQVAAGIVTAYVGPVHAARAAVHAARSFLT